MKTLNESNELIEPTETTFSDKDRRRARIAGVIGNVVEWYDFALYGYLAVVIGGLFFPAEDPTTSLLASYGVFAAGFIMRPLGAAFFGWLGDTIGRGRTMLISVAMMAFPTIALGVLPTYEMIGIVAPVLLITLRLIQGLSVGGEFSSSVTYMVETAPDNGRGRAGSWANVGSMIGMLLGSAAAALSTTLFSDEVLHAWGWRIPFLAGGILGFTAIMLRRHLPASPHFHAHEKNTPSKSPLVQVWQGNRKELFQAFFFASSYGVTFYLVMVYLPGWLARNFGIEESRALQINSMLTLVQIPLMVIFAWIGDVYIRRTRWIAIAFGALGLLAWPILTMMGSGSILAIIFGQLILFALLSVALGSAPATFVELFPNNDRLTGYSVAFNLGIGVLGGATPALVTWLIGVTGNTMMPAIMMTLAGILAVISLLMMKDRSRESLR